MRINTTFTIAAGTPINVATGMTATQMTSNGYGAKIPSLYVSRVFIQMLPGASAGIGYVMDGIYGVNAAGTGPRVPASTNAADVTAELAPAISTAPGGSYTDIDNSYTGTIGIDLSKMWVDGAHTGDTVKISYNQLV